MRNVSYEIERFAEQGVFIDLLIDAYKLGEGSSYCFRGCVTWRENGKWKEDDCGCYPSWDQMFEKVIELAEFILNNKK